MISPQHLAWTEMARRRRRTRWNGRRRRWSRSATLGEVEACSRARDWKRRRLGRGLYKAGQRGEHATMRE